MQRNSGRTFRKYALKKILLASLFVLLIFILVPIGILLIPPAAIEYAQPSDTAVSPQPNPPCPAYPHTDSPPCNPSLADSAWNVSHGSSYAQGSSDFPGLAAAEGAIAQHLNLGGVPITLNFTPPYADGGTAVWGSPLSLNGLIVKIDHDSFKIIDIYDPQEREENPPKLTLGISGAYSALDSDGRFIVGRQRAIELYEDKIVGDRFSPIILRQRLQLPDDFFCRADDLIVGLSMTYDDQIAIVSEQGVVGLIPRQTTELTAENMRSFSINGAKCADQNSALEIVSNNLAIDEVGGIFVVTSQQMIRLDWDGTQLTETWRADYEVGSGGISPIRLGSGSGSTPSLMGTAQDEDKFVLITDGQTLMHLVLLWRDEIPVDWVAIGTDKDRRIACEVPITFGDPQATRSLSEQSVLVSGYAAVIVNNQLTQEPRTFPNLPSFVNSAFAAAAGGKPDFAPYGIERIDWNPETRQCETVWANTALSIPNGIPTMSRTTGLFYGIGQREGVWGLEAVNFADGQSEFFVPSAQTKCSLTAIRQLNPFALRLLTAMRSPANPRNCENSFYAATEVGPDGTIYTGTFLGVSKFSPKE